MLSPLTITPKKLLTWITHEKFAHIELPQNFTTKKLLTYKMTWNFIKFSCVLWILPWNQNPILKHKILPSNRNPRDYPGTKIHITLKTNPTSQTQDLFSTCVHLKGFALTKECMHSELSWNACDLWYEQILFRCTNLFRVILGPGGLPLKTKSAMTWRECMCVCRSV